MITIPLASNGHCFVLDYIYIKTPLMRYTKLWAWLLLFALAAMSAPTQANPPVFWKYKGQKVPVNHFLTTGGGLGAVAYRDQLSSQRAFNGISTGLFQSYELRTLRKLFVVDGMVQFGAATDGSGWGGSTAATILINHTAAFLFHVPFEKSRLNWHFGPAAQFYGMFRPNTSFGNGALGYDVLSGLGVRSRLELPVTLRTKSEQKWWIFKIRKIQERTLRFGWEIDLPLMALNSRPPFVGVLDGVGNDPISTGVIDFMENTQFGIVGRYFYMNSRLYAQYPLRNGNRLQMSYHWQGYQYNYQDQPVRTAAGALMFSYMFRLDANKDLR
jgi:hypothetical protein